MKVLALDTSRKRTGIAFDGGDGFYPRCTSRGFGDPQASIGFILLQFKNFLVDLIALQRPDVIAVESPPITGLPTSQREARIQIGMIAIVQVICEAAGIRYTEMAVSTARAKFVGNGRPGRNAAEAKEIVRHQCEVLGWKVANTDESDAACVWYAAKTTDPKFRLETGPLLAVADAARRVA